MLNWVFNRLEVWIKPIYINDVCHCWFCRLRDKILEYNQRDVK